MNAARVFLSLFVLDRFYGLFRWTVSRGHMGQHCTELHRLAFLHYIDLVLPKTSADEAEVDDAPGVAVPGRELLGVLAQDPCPGDPGLVGHALVPVGAPLHKELQGAVGRPGRLVEVALDQVALRQERVGLGQEGVKRQALLQARDVGYNLPLVSGVLADHLPVQITRRPLRLVAERM